MATLEKSLKKRLRHHQLRTIILKTISAAGLISIALLAPNALRLLSSFEGEYRRKQGSKYLIANTFNKLKNAGFISVETGKNGTFVRLTAKGRELLHRVNLEEHFGKPPPKWDQKWRILIFDIKEAKKGTRDKLRTTLRRIGFLRLQDSVWIFPYDCEDFIVLLKADFKIGREVVYIIADSIENDIQLKKHFDLK